MMVEEVAFGLCECYATQLRQLHFETPKKMDGTLTQLAEVAAFRMREYLHYLRTEGALKEKGKSWIKGSKDKREKQESDEEQKMRETHQELFREDPVAALIRSVRIFKLSGDNSKKKEIEIAEAKDLQETKETERPVSPSQPRDLSHWTMHGLFSQSGIRAISPGRSSHYFDFEAPDPKKLTAHPPADEDGIYYTNVKRYGYANGTKEDAMIARMNELRP